MQNTMFMGWGDEELHKIPMCEFFLKVALDILSPLPKIEHGNKYILVTMDD
jgi:hypothetical protein